MESKTSLETIIALYKESVKELPFLKYSWAVIAGICILFIIIFLKIGTFADVFKGIFMILGLSFLAFLLSFLTNIKDKPIRILLYIVVYVLCLSLCFYIALVSYYALTNKSNKLTDYLEITNPQKTFFFNKKNISSEFGGFVKSNSLMESKINDFYFFINQSSEDNFSLITFNLIEKTIDNPDINIIIPKPITFKSKKFAIVKDSIYIEYYPIDKLENNQKINLLFSGIILRNAVSGKLNLEVSENYNPYISWNIPVKLNK